MRRLRSIGSGASRITSSASDSPSRNSITTKERAVVGGAEVGDVDDVLVPDGAGQPRLLQQPRDEVALGEELLQQHLHRHALADDRVLGLVDGAHPALADAADDLVAVGEHGADQGIEAGFLLAARGRSP